MNVRQAAEQLEISAALVYQLVREGRLGHLRIGAAGSRGKIVISDSDIERFRESVRLAPRDQSASSPVKLRHLKV
jgi:excisionase family DNA binding protein